MLLKTPARVKKVPGHLAHKDFPSDCSLHTALCQSSVDLTIRLQGVDGLSIEVEFWRELRQRSRWIGFCNG